jgi:hypothetical protein
MHHRRSGEDRQELDTVLPVCCCITHDTFPCCVRVTSGGSLCILRYPIV